MPSIASRRAAGLRLPAELLPALSAGVTVGILTILTQVSFATLLFQGALRPFLASGVAMTLAGAAVIGSVLALRGSFRGTIGRPHELPVVIVALLLGRILAELPDAAPGADPFTTTLVLINGTTALFGLCSLLLGLGRVGDLFRFLPYPVLGGFVAGSGLLLVKGGITVMLEIGADRPMLPLLLEPAQAGRWLPGLLFGVVMLLAARRWRHWSTIPACLIAGVVCFQLLLAVCGLSAEQARLAGLIPGMGLLATPGQLPHLPPLGPVAWTLLARHIPDMLTVAFIASLGTLLNASAIEVTVRQELDLNQDLRAVGLANLLAAVCGSPAGFHSLSSTALPHQMGVRGRVPALVSAGLCLAVLLGGNALVAQIPFAVSGGLLLFLGFSLLASWLIDQRGFLTRKEFLVLVAILLCTVTAGWMAAIVFGLVLAVVLFTFDYSQASAIRVILTGRTRRSNVDRSEARRRILDRYGDSILIVCLQGHLFFGTAHGLLRTIRERIESPPLHQRPHWLLIDLRLGSGLDASAIHAFIRLRQVCEALNVELLFTALPEHLRDLLLKTGILTGASEGIDWFRDLDHGLEFCENELLAIHAREIPETDGGLDSILEVSDAREPSVRQRLLRYFTTCSWPAGSTIIRQDAPPAHLYLLLSGTVVVERNQADGSPPIRLRTMDPGTCIGEISFYGRGQTTASVVAAEAVTTLRLSLEDLDRMEAEDPAAAALLHRLVARRLGERLALTNQLVLSLGG